MIHAFFNMQIENATTTAYGNREEGGGGSPCGEAEDAVKGKTER